MSRSPEDSESRATGSPLGAVRLSAIAGGLKVLGQIGLALITYPLIISAGGLETLGAWVLLVSVVGYGNLVHCGMAPLLSLEVAKDAVRGLESFRPALAIASTISGVVLLFALLGAEWMGTALGHDVGGTLPSTAIFVTAAGVVLRLSSAMYSALLTGIHRNHLVYLAQFAQTIVFIVVFVLGEGQGSIFVTLSLSYAGSYLVEFVLVLASVRRYIPDALRTRPTLAREVLRDFGTRLRPYAMTEAALLGREPLLKLAVFLAGSSELVGVFELASRIPAVLRQTFVVGLNALLPAVAAVAERSREAIAELVSFSLRYLILGGCGALLLYGLNAELLLEIWLGDAQAEVATLSLWLTAWWAVTALNVPAWWIGVGMGQIWTNTKVVWFHLLVSILLVPLAVFADPSMHLLVGVWVAGGLLMQGLLYWSLERSTEVIRLGYLSRTVGADAAVFFAIAVASAAVGSLGTGFVRAFWTCGTYFSLALPWYAWREFRTSR